MIAMSDEEMGSMTLWARLYEEPNEPGLWKAFVHRYKPLVLRWTRKWLCDSNDHEEMFAEFCKKVHEKITDGNKKRFTPQNDSYRAVLYAVVRNLCLDYLKKKGKHTSNLMPDDARVEHDRWLGQAEDDFVAGLNELEEEEIERERALRRLAEYREFFREALIRRKSQPQYDPKSTEIFFQRYHEAVPVEELDEKYKFGYRDGSGRYARRERDRLVKLMGLPTETEREAKLAEVIVTVLARVYGDVSTTAD
jgi:RNA polymerase sigma factor (sigma-70 family)